MKYVPTYEQFINEKYKNSLNEAKEVDLNSLFKKNKIQVLIDNTEDEITSYMKSKKFIFQTKKQAERWTANFPAASYSGMEGQLYYKGTINKVDILYGIEFSYYKGDVALYAQPYYATTGEKILSLIQGDRLKSFAEAYERANKKTYNELINLIKDDYKKIIDRSISATTEKIK